MFITHASHAACVLASIITLAQPAVTRAEPPASQPVAATGQAVRTACERVINGLDADQRKLADQPYDPAAIRLIKLFPGERVGVRLGDLDDAQRSHVRRLLGTLFSDAGLEHAEKVFGQGSGPGDYYFARFTDDAQKGPLSWRVEGHHFSVTVFIDKDNIVRPGTILLGGNPPDVWADLRQAAKSVYASLDPELQKDAQAATPPRRTGNEPYSDPVASGRLPFERLDREQRAQVTSLLDRYARLFQPTALASVRRDFDEKGGPEKLFLAFAGLPAAPDGEFYCGLTGAGLHCEFDSRQGHIHMLLHFGPAPVHQWSER